MVIRILKQGYILLMMAIALPAFAENSWNNYHWARSSAPFELTIVNSTTNDWDVYVSQATGDWSQSSVLDMLEDANGATSKQVRRKCKGPTGQVRICNLSYGQTGWLGIAGISIDTNGHITTGNTNQISTQQ